MKRLHLFLLFVIIIPVAYSISIKELLARYSFFAVTAQMNLTGYRDFMIDANNNGINDTLIFELTANNAAGSFIFAINLFDRDGILANETNKTLQLGINKINVTFSSTLLGQSQFNYSIKIYNLSHSLKYRKDNILTQNYSSYEEGFRVLDVKDSKSGKNLNVTVSVNSPINGSHVTTLFLSYNNSIILSKSTRAIANSINSLSFIFDNETVKRTHYNGNFNISSVKIGRKTIKTNSATASYDFRDFAASSYIAGFADGMTGSSNNKYDNLLVNASLNVIGPDNYNLVFGLYDLFGNLVEQKNISSFMNDGSNLLPVAINGTKINEKKLNGPFVVKYAALYKNNYMVDQISDAYTTSNYNFNDFDNQEFPDLKVDVGISGAYHYGISNITINFTVKNIGRKPAFNVFSEIFDNKTFSQSRMLDVLNQGSQTIYQLNFTGISDFEISAIADLQNFVEELNESNNAQRIVIRLNKKPVLESVKNITANETDTIIINLSALDPNDDNLSYSINMSKFSNNLSVFKWKTTLLDSGNYTISAAASDGFLNDSVVFKIIVIDNTDADSDNDGIDDGTDNLLGDENSVNTSTINVTIFLDESRNLSKFFNETRKIRMKDGNSTVAEFDYNFSWHKLNLKNLTINKQNGNATGYLVMKGLELPQGWTKTLYIDRINPNVNGICIKEEEISSISQVSNNCDSSNEFKVECDGTLQNSYTCNYNSTLNKYKVPGLRHSGIMQFDYTAPVASSGSNPSSGEGSSSSGGSGGGSLACTPDWKCGGWSKCMNGFENRKCQDANKCPFSHNISFEFLECTDAAEKEPFNLIKTFKQNEIVNKIKDNAKKFAGVTGQVVSAIPKIKNFSDVADIIALALVLVSCYLAISAVFKN